MNLTVSRRQQKLYDSKGFNLDRYNNLVQEGNDLRREIRAVASEYDVEWDERRDAQDERVVEALKEHRGEFAFLEGPLDVESTLLTIAQMRRRKRRRMMTMTMIDDAASFISFHFLLRSSEHQDTLLVEHVQ